MPDASPISPSLNRKLREAKPDDLVGVLIRLNPSEGLDKALENLPLGDTAERRETVASHNQTSMDLIKSHLDAEGVRYIVAPLLGVVTTNMTPSQITEISEQPYVGYITDNKEVSISNQPGVHY